MYVSSSPFDLQIDRIIQALSTDTFIVATSQGFNLSQNIFGGSTAKQNYVDNFGGKTISGGPLEFINSGAVKISLDYDTKIVEYSTRSGGVFWKFKIEQMAGNKLYIFANLSRTGNW